jgi:dihydropyrimidinase
VERSQDVTGPAVPANHSNHSQTGTSSHFGGTRRKTPASHSGFVPGGPDGTLVVQGGTVVAESGPRLADLVVERGTIAALAEPGSGPARGERLDATGCFVLPGGVDPHSHVMPDVAAATRAAALGGTTTVLSFTNPEPGEGALACLLRRREEVTRGQPAVDVGLHAMLYQPDLVEAADLAALRDAGVSGVKVFLAYPELGIMWSTRGLLGLMTAAARHRQVVQVHCEDGQLIEALLAAAVADGRTGPAVFAETRPPEAEEAAVAVALATARIAGAACYLTHLSCAGALDQVRLSRGRRTPGPHTLHTEVCLHHLLLDDGCYSGPDAGRYLVAPPLRSPGHPDALWAAVADGTIDTVGSDHCQTRSAVTGGILGPGEAYQYGIAGIGARLPLLLSEGLARGVPIDRLMRLLSENPARIFGHFPRKGSLAPGSDADLVVFDPAGETVVGPDSFADGTGPSVYADRRVRGRIRAVLLRGEPLVRDGLPVAGPPRGRYLRTAGQAERGQSALAAAE